MRPRATRLVRASKLPAIFEIPTTWHEPARGVATREGRRNYDDVATAAANAEAWEASKIALAALGLPIPAPPPEGT